MEPVVEQWEQGYQLPLEQGKEAEAKALRPQVLAEEAQVRRRSSGIGRMSRWS